MDNSRFLARRPAARLQLLVALPARGQRSAALLALALLPAWSGLWLPASLAQNANRDAGKRTPKAVQPANAASGAAVAAPAVAPRLNAPNVLILAFDDLNTPLATPAFPASGAVSTAGLSPGVPPSLPALPDLGPPLAAEVPVTPAVPEQPAPRRNQAPVPSAPNADTVGGPAIRPSSGAARPLVAYRALAQQRDKTPKPAGKRTRIRDDDFLPVPEPLPALRPSEAEPGGAANDAAAPRRNGAGDANAPTDATGATGAPDAGAGFSGANPGSPFTRAATGGAAGSLAGAGSGSLDLPGRAYLSALPLRRALTRAGFGDVLTVTPSSPTLSLVVDNHRLSPRVLEAARAGLAELAALSNQAPAPSGADGDAETNAEAQARWTSLYQAAARVGQAVGYRAVVVLGVLPRPAEGKAGATYALAVVDALRESGEPLVFDEEGASESVANESAALVASAVVSRALSAMPVVSNEEKAQRASEYMNRARTAHLAGDFPVAQDFLSQVLAFEPTRVEARLLMADVLGRSDPAAAAQAYRALATLEGLDGPAWAKAAVAFTMGPAPEWPRALESARKAIALGHDTSELRQAMATAQMGRAALFRAASRPEKADEAEAEARVHLERALAMTPDDPGAIRLMVAGFVEKRQFREAVRILDRVALQYPDDVGLQSLYAGALLEMGNRDEDAFAAFARVWRISGQTAVPVDAARYKRLSDGFDRRLVTLGKRAAQLSSSVAAGTSPQETALLQMSRFKEDMDGAIAAIKVMQPGFDTRFGTAHSTRVFAADLMSQALGAYAVYLETGQEILRERANGLQRQAILLLNTARTARN
jgi:tetratricopeptide (TPR) repeat protein